VDSTLEVKLQLVMHRINSLILLSLLFFILLPTKGFSQCPGKVIVENQGPADSGILDLYAYDSFDSGIDISDFEVNIFSEEEGKYLVIESTNFPSIGLNNDIQINKEGNRIQLANFPGNIDLLRCIVIFIGDDCPVQKITITNR
jgi:hypothetical protein